ncbi:uncharacterized protein DS421_12g376250 [Arachis hypogaea]|nr:uncharacterized protein DS421_12g376250 [Arachis hypogaea]
MYNILYEVSDEINVKDANLVNVPQPKPMQDGPHVAVDPHTKEPIYQVQNESGPRQHITKKVLRHGAEKKFQSQRKVALYLGPQKLGKGNKPKAKEIAKKEINLEKVLVLSQPISSSSRNPNVVAMEREMLKSMRRLQKEQRDSVQVLTKSKKDLKDHVVKNNLFNQVQESFSSRLKLKPPKQNLFPPMKPPDATMETLGILANDGDQIMSESPILGLVADVQS